RRDLNVIAFTNRFARVAIALLRSVSALANPRVVAGLARPQCSRSLFFDSRRLAKSELPRGLDQLVSAQPLTERGEVVVARICDGLRWCEWRQMIFMDAGQ